MEDRLELLFLKLLLRTVILGVLTILIADLVIYPEDYLSITIDVVILSSCVAAYVFRKRYYTTSVVVTISITLLAMLAQAFLVPVNTTTSFSIILFTGFITSILLNGKVRWIMHIVGYGIILAIFIIQTINPELRFLPDLAELSTILISYLIIYSMLISFSMMLKSKYDSMVRLTREANEELKAKATEIEAQNEELLQIQDQLSDLNRDLETKINLRTQQIVQQNELLINFSFANAHHLRGPVARLLGLINLYRIENDPDVEFFMNHIEDQVNEVDQVVRQIGAELSETIQLPDNNSIS